MRKAIAAPASAAPQARGLQMLYMKGDSMLPTVAPGAPVIVDTNDVTPSPPGLFVVWDGFGLVVKRVQVIVGSAPLRVKIWSDNPAYQAWECALSGVRTYGRVVAQFIPCDTDNPLSTAAAPATAPGLFLCHQPAPKSACASSAWSALRGF